MLEPVEPQKPSFERPTLQSEPVRIQSGQLLVIDQYMLGNPQFLEGLERSGGSPAHVQDYGGLALEMIPGTWKVYRFARERVFLVCPESVSEDEVLQAVDRLSAQGADEGAVGRVFIETRCVVFLDAELLRGAAITGEFSQLRRAGQEKEARDYLRQNGAAVRYGFDQECDDLKVVVMEPTGYLALVPSVRPPLSETE